MALDATGDGPYGLSHRPKVVQPPQPSYLKDKNMLNRIKTIIIGHEHPAIALTERGRTERFKCHLKGKWKNGKKQTYNLLVMPSLNPLIEGSNVLAQLPQSPFLKTVKDLEAFVVEGDEVYAFGNVDGIIEKKRTER